MRHVEGRQATSYFDSSALVKRYVVESGTSWVQTRCSDPAQIVAVAEIGLVEIAAAFAGKLRGGFITSDEYGNIRFDLERDAQEEYVLVGIQRTAIDDAIELTSRHRLRGYDAVHLACALRLNQALSTYALPSLVLISSDTDLLAAAEAEGLGVDNPDWHL